MLAGSASRVKADVLAFSATRRLWEAVMEWARLALDYLKVLLSTPVIIGAVIVLFMCRFRSSIRAMLERPFTFRAPGGFEATVGGQAEVAQEVAQQGAQLTRAEPAAAPVPPEQVAMLQQIGRWWMYERLYRVIFRSQIELLRFLAGQPNRQARVSELMPFYQQAVTRGLLAAAYPFENYLNFLRTSLLIQWTGPGVGQEPVVTLTRWGGEFLDYIANSNYVWTVERFF